MNPETTGLAAIPPAPLHLGSSRSSREIPHTLRSAMEVCFLQTVLMRGRRSACGYYGKSTFDSVKSVAKNPCLIHWEAGHRLQSLAAFRPTSNFTWSSLDFPQPFQHRKTGSETVRNGQFALPPKTLPCKGSSVATQEPEKLSISLTPATYTISSGDTLPKLPYFMVKFW